MFYKLDWKNDSHCIGMAEAILEWASEGATTDEFQHTLRNCTVWDLLDDLVSCIDDVTLRDAAEVIQNTIGPNRLPMAPPFKETT